MGDAAKAKWLGDNYPPAESPQRNQHLKNALLDLKVLESDDSVTLFATPASVQVIAAGGMAMSKWWAGLVAAGFGGSALAQGLKALDWLPGADEVVGIQQNVLTGSAALVASAAVVAIALIVKGDVSARARATSAQYKARAAIATALIQGFQYEAPPPAPAPLQPQHIGRSKADKWFTVQQFEWGEAGMVARVDADTTVPVREIAWITPYGVWNE